MRQKQSPLVIVCDMLTYSNFKTKKMYSRFRNGNCSNIVGYTPPTLHKGVRWFVDFTAWDPARDAMRRKRCYIKDSLSVPAKKHRASEIIAVLTNCFPKVGIHGLQMMKAEVSFFLIIAWNIFPSM